MKKVWKQRYQIMDEVGEGGNAKVYKVWDMTLEKIWAMKMLEEKNMPVSLTVNGEEEVNELQVLKSISHVNFPRIVDAFEEDNRKILIMDYIHGVTLEEIIEKGPMKEKEILFVLKQVCEAVLYLHHRNPVLLFLDLKPSNIMVEETGTVKLVDLGSVTVKGSRGKISGSFGYASPEQVKVQREGCCLLEQSDIFSFGMVLYAMITGNCHRLPIVEAGSRRGIYVRKRNYKGSVFEEKILEKCTRGIPLKRYGSMREVKSELENWEKGLKKKERIFKSPVFGKNKEKNRWYQEKSIFCTEGRHSFYIAKKILVLFLCGICLLWGKETLAKEKGEDVLAVIVRDTKFRKVLVKKGCAYETTSNILLEIPWEEIGGKQCQIVVECENEVGEKKRFYIESIYAK